MDHIVWSRFIRQAPIGEANWSSAPATSSADFAFESSRTIGKYLLTSTRRFRAASSDKGAHPSQDPCELSARQLTIRLVSTRACEYCSEFMNFKTFNVDRTAASSLEILPASVACWEKEWASATPSSRRSIAVETKSRSISLFSLRS